MLLFNFRMLNDNKYAWSRIIDLIAKTIFLFIERVYRICYDFSNQILLMKF